MNIITLGTFDILHAGHIKLFKRCKELSGGWFVTVGLNTDDFIEKYKGKPPIMSYEERKKSILETGLVDKVIPNSQDDGTAKEPIIKSEAGLIVIGSDWHRKDYVGQLGISHDWLDEMEIGVAYVPYTKWISTTEIKKRIYDSLSDSNKS